MIEVGVIAHTCNLTTQEAEVGELWWVQDHCERHTDFQDSLGYRETLFCVGGIYRQVCCAPACSHTKAWGRYQVSCFTAVPFPLRQGLTRQWPVGPSALTAVPASHSTRATCGCMEWTHVFTRVLGFKFRFSFISALLPTEPNPLGRLFGWLVFGFVFPDTVIRRREREEKVKGFSSGVAVFKNYFSNP